MAPRMKVEASPSQPVQSQPQVQAPKPTATAPKPKVDAPRATVEAPKQASDAPKATTSPKPAVSAPKASVEAPVPAADASQQTQEQAAPAPTAAQSAVPKQPLSSKIKVQPSATQDPHVEDPWDYEPTPVASNVAQPAPSQQEDVSSAGASQSAPAQNRQSKLQALSQWYHKTFAGHEHAFWGAVIALLVAALTFLLGPLRMLLICVLVFVGVAVGQIFDGDPKIIRMIRGLFDNDREER